jgi:hypothetical protein
VIEVDKKREATASIRGYFYQLDATLLTILDAKLDDEVVIEGIEDFDRYSFGEITYSQVKYYEAQALTNSVLREPLFKLFQHFYGLKETERFGRKYVLYGHYKEINIELDGFTAERFKEVMTYVKVEKDKSRTKLSHLDALQCSDELINMFCSKFEIYPAKEFSAQHDEVVSKLGTNQKVSEIEATGFHYPRAFDFIATLATEKNHLKRATSLRELQEHLKGTQAIHHSWLLREKSATEYARFMRKLYFSHQNAAGVIRVFILEAEKGSDHQKIADQVLEIAKKWSSYKSVRTPNADRYAPFVMLRNAEKSLAQEVKNSLYERGLEFVDGYPYLGSQFRADQVRLAQTKERAIAVRLVDDLSQLEDALDGMSRKPVDVFDFFTDAPMALKLAGARIRGFSIPIDDITHIKSII